MNERADHSEGNDLPLSHCQLYEDRATRTNAAAESRQVHIIQRD